MSDTWVERLIMGFIVLLVVLLFGIVVGLIVDMGWHTTIHDTGIVRGKEYEPATTRVVSGVDAKGNPTVSTRYVSEKFIILLQTEKSGHVTVEVKQALYDLLTEGDQVFYTYNRGKLGGTVSGQRIEPR